MACADALLLRPLSAAMWPPPVSSLPALLSSPELLTSRVCAGALVALWLVGLVAPTAGGELFGLIPGRALSSYSVWTFVTAGFYETSLPMGALNIAAAVLVCPALERLWGSRALAVFLLAMDVSVLLSVWAGLIGLYALTEAEMFLFRVVCGFSGVSAALLVALKQRWPEQALLPLPLFSRVQLQHLPLLACSLALLCWLGGWMGGKETPLVCCGTVFSFLYLRFYARDPDTGLVGDLRPDFAFATLFPDVWGVRGVVNLVVAIPFHALMKAGFFAEALKSGGGLPLSSASAASPTSSDATALLVGSASMRAVDPQAERRRILAIKAIDEKLAELAKHATEAQAGGAAAAHTSNTAAPHGVEGDDAVDAAHLPGEEELQRLEREVQGGAHSGRPSDGVIIGVREDDGGGRSALP